MSASPIIRCSHLRRDFGAVQALRSVDLEVEVGEAVAIMGRSGSGKSTLLHILGLLDTPSGGSYQLNGEDVASLSDRDRSRLRAESIGFVFQAFHLIPQLTLLENVLLAYHYHPAPPADRLQRAREAVDRVGLSHRLHHRPAELSGGEMQRAAIARALVTDPRLVLADEPTGNLDSQTETEVMGHLTALREEGITLILVTHDERVAAACDRTVVLADGQVAI